MLAVCAAFQVGANESQEKQQQLLEIQSRIHLVQKSLGNLTVKKNSVVAKLRDNERLYGNLSKTVNKLEQQILEQEQRLQLVREQRDEKKNLILSQKTSLSKQIRAAHAMGRQEHLKLLLNQQDPVRAGRMLVYYDYFNKARLSRVNAFSKILQELKNAEDELLFRTQSLTELRQDKKTEAAALIKAKSERKQLLTKLDKEYRNRNNELLRLRNDERQLQRLIRSIQNAMDDVPYQSVLVKPFKHLRGQLKWPVKGKLEKRFGNARLSGRWEGVLIKAKEGDVVHTVSSGRVIYADWLRGYGMLTIIDHGSGYVTLYAYNQSLYKAAGDTVDAGEPIAAVGRSGGRASPGLYFEIRKNGKPVNPQKWCRKARKGRVG